MSVIEMAQRKTAYEALGSQPFNALLDEIRQRARQGEFDEQRHISNDIIAKFKELGIYRALVPHQLGGDECSPHQFCELIETISRADGSAGWVASFGMGVVYLSALPLETLKKVYADTPDLVFAGGIFPPQPAQYVEGGLNVKGRWKFSSGSMGADVLGVGISPRNGDEVGLPRMAVMKASQAKIEKTWNVTGLIGTGSHDLIVDNVVVPESYTFVRGGKSNLSEPMFRYPALSFAAQVLAVVGLGIGRAALDEIEAIAQGRDSVTGAPKLAERPISQVGIAKAEAKLRAARSFFYDAIDDAWETLLAGDEVSVEQTSLLRLSATNVARVGAEVAREVQMLSGMTGVYRDNPMARFVADAQVVTQHAFMGDITYQNAGAVFFGQKPLPGYL